ncbi:MAG: ribosomal-processing cysteine protease Prp [Lachnospiraceae bacterium]|nr:ribosomal-processing cysteine protease Prp [Lachnospiraceae bacterium]
MITFTVFKDSDNIYRAFSSTGHAKFAKFGKDIVCSAVSVLVINTINSIEQFTDDKFDANVEDGLVTFSFKDRVISHESTLLMDSLVLGINGIVSDYPKHIQILFKEV